ncbi:hypothetical protein [Nitrospira sp. M1]
MRNTSYFLSFLRNFCFTSTLLILVLSYTNVQAEITPKIQEGLAQARLIVGHNETLIQEKSHLLKLMQSSAKSKRNIFIQKRKVQEAQESLENAVRLFSFTGDVKTAVVNAKTLLYWKQRYDESSGDSSFQDFITKEMKQTLQQIKKLSIKEQLENEADARFSGFGFGVAIGVTIKAGARDRIQSAALDANGIVRVDRDNNTTANFLLESHYFFTPKMEFCCGLGQGDWGVGPFVGVRPGTDNIIEAVGAGIMVGFKRANIVASDIATQRGDSFNLGLGVMVNPNAKVLGDGIRKDQPLPTGESDVRFKTTTELGWLAVFSYSF